jgi:hypothetical protein
VDQAPSHSKDALTGLGAPTNVRATGGPAGLGGLSDASITWTPPASGPGVPPITHYKIQSVGPTARTVEIADGKLTGYTMTGLAAGSYTFNVSAGNMTAPATTIDYGPAGASNAVTVPATGVPDAPTSVTATPGNQSAVLSWVAPVSSGSSPISGYRVEAGLFGSGSAQQTISTGPEARGAGVTGLVNGTRYEFRVYALNASGQSAPGTADTTPVPVVPGPPTGVLATRGNAQVTLSWTPPADNGGSPISDYKIVAFPVGGTSSTYFISTAGNPNFNRTDITGLTNGTTYTFDVSAGNKTGPGATTAYGNPGRSNAATPATVPGAPTGLSATPRHQSVTLRWTAPLSNGGDPITGYRVAVSPFIAGSPFTVPGSDTVYTVNGLTNGTSYTFTVTAFNTVGNGPDSTPVTAAPQTTVADAPAPATATRGNQLVTLRWTVPAYNGGLAIDSYQVQVFTGTTLVRTVTVAGAATNTTTVDTLINGTAYTFRIAAHNAAGNSADAVTGAVTPATVPDKPNFRNLSPPVDPDKDGVTAGQGMVTLRWTGYPNPIVCNPTPPAPQTAAECHPTGGDAVTSYQIVTMAGTTPVNGLTTSITTSGDDSPRATVEGLAAGTEYTFRIAAKNGAGASDVLVLGPVRVGSRIRFNIASNNYGAVLIGTSSDPLVISVTNWGSDDLVVNKPLISSTPAGNNFTVTLDTCSGNIIPAKSSCEIDLSFSPVARGAISGSFSLDAGSIDPSPTISLSGTGVGPSVAYAPASLTFPNTAVGDQSAIQTVTITNTSDPAAGGTGRDLHINSLSIEGFGSPNFLIDQAADLCSGATITPGSSCTVGLRFAPIRTGATDANLRVEHDAFVDPARVTFSGTGVAPAEPPPGGSVPPQDGGEGSIDSNN